MPAILSALNESYPKPSTSAKQDKGPLGLLKSIAEVMGKGVQKIREDAGLRGQLAKLATGLTAMNPNAKGGVEFGMTLQEVIKNQILSDYQKKVQSALEGGQEPPTLSGSDASFIGTEEPNNLVSILMQRMAGQKTLGLQERLMNAQIGESEARTSESNARRDAIRAGKPIEPIVLGANEQLWVNEGGGYTLKATGTQTGQTGQAKSFTLKDIDTGKTIELRHPETGRLVASIPKDAEGKPMLTNFGDIERVYVPLMTQLSPMLTGELAKKGTANILGGKVTPDQFYSSLSPEGKFLWDTYTPLIVNAKPGEIGNILRALATDAGTSNVLNFEDLVDDSTSVSTQKGGAVETTKLTPEQEYRQILEARGIPKEEIDALVRIADRRKLKQEVDKIKKNGKDERPDINRYSPGQLGGVR